MTRFDKAVTLIREQFERENTHHQPGMAISIDYQGEIYHYHFGKASLESNTDISHQTRFHAASLAKQFTGYAISLLNSTGRLSTNDSIVKYLKFIPPIAHNITIKHLLNHTSGLRDQWVLKFLAGFRDEDVVTMDDIKQLISHQKSLNFIPGMEHSYCNTGYTLLAMIVEKVSNEPFEDFVRKNIFIPAGMISSLMRRQHNLVLQNEALAYRFDIHTKQYFRSLPPLNVLGATSLITTSEDLISWARYLNKLKISEIFPRGKLNNGESINYACGLIKAKYKEELLYHHSGWDYGYSSLIMTFPEHKFSISILANCFTPSLEILGTKLAGEILDIGIHHQLISTVTFQKDLPVDKICDDDSPFEGVFIEDSTEELISFRKGDDGLILDVAQGYPLLRMTENEYLIKGTTSSIRWVANGCIQRYVAGKWLNYRRIPVEKPLFKVHDISGSYYSEELNITISIYAVDGELRLKFPKGESYLLSHLTGEKYLFNGMIVQFCMEFDTLVAMRVSHPRAKKITYIKVLIT